MIARVGSGCGQQGYNPIYITEGEGFAMDLAHAPGLEENLWSEYGQVPFSATIPAMTVALDNCHPGLGNNVNGWSWIAVEAWSWGFLAPPLTFTAGQPHPVDCWFTGRVSNATTSVVNGGKVTCENGSSASSS